MRTSREQAARAGVPRPGQHRILTERPSDARYATRQRTGGNTGRRRQLDEILVEFDTPRILSRLVYEVEEATRERTQEVRVEVSEDGGRTYRQILVQEYNFSPAGATFQREQQRFNLRQASHLRLTIVPNKSGSGIATLTSFRLFA
jgi:hypothetical protein